MAAIGINGPFGPIVLESTTGETLSRVRFGGSMPTRATTTFLDDAARQFSAYFAGTLHDFDLPLAPAATPFQRRVRAAMRAIPYGETRSYGDLARDLGSAARAVGQACGRNPLPIIVPCHRVLAAGGALGGFSAGDGVATKVQILNFESRHAP
jgi:methylated-DNA-[protein]-cysteine S-methyltransferase